MTSPSPAFMAVRDEDKEEWLLYGVGGGRTDQFGLELSDFFLVALDLLPAPPRQGEQHHTCDPASGCSTTALLSTEVFWPALDERATD